MAEINYFARICDDQAFKQWLAKEKAAVTKILATADGANLHRAQGRYSLIEEIEERLDKAARLR